MYFQSNGHFKFQISIDTVFFSLQMFNKLTHLSLQLQFRHPFATCGLFVFNWKLLFTVSVLQLINELNLNKKKSAATTIIGCLLRMRLI